MEYQNSSQQSEIKNMFWHFKVHVRDSCRWCRWWSKIKKIQASTATGVSGASTLILVGEAAGDR